jgi:hypothetical protein
MFLHPNSCETAVCQLPFPTTFTRLLSDVLVHINFRERMWAINCGTEGCTAGDGINKCRRQELDTNLLTPELDK